MSKYRLLAMTIIAGLALTLPAAGQGDADFIGGLGAETRIQAFESLKASAAQQGLELEDDATFLTQGESTIVFAPVARIGYFVRAQFANWTTVGVFTALGPADAEQASGTFRAEVRAKSEHGSEAQFRIVSQNGEIVQEGDTVLDTNPDNESPATTGLDAKPPEGKYYLARFGCPWYYPYFRPYYYRAWPYYKNGCYWYGYRWWWGHLHFRFCWWPSRFCLHCRHHW